MIIRKILLVLPLSIFLGACDYSVTMEADSSDEERNKEIVIAFYEIGRAHV